MDKDKVSEAARSVDEAAQVVLQQAAAVKDSMAQVGGGFDSAVRDSIREQPMTTLAVAVVIGFLVGAVWKS